MNSCAIPGSIKEYTPETTPTKEAAKSKEGSEQTSAKIVIFDFKPIGVSKENASNATALMRSEMTNTGKYTIVENNKVDLTLKEQGFQDKYVTDEKEAAKIGKTLSVNTIMIGSFEKKPGTFLITASIVDVEKGSIVYTEKQAFTSERNIPDAVKFIAANLTGKLFFTPDAAPPVPNSTSGKKFNYGDFKNADMSNKDYSNSEFKYANIFNAKMLNSKFVGSSFKYANMINANLINSDFTNAEFDYAILTGADLSDSIFTGASFGYAKVSVKWKTYLLNQNVKNYNLIGWVNSK